MRLIGSLVFPNCMSTMNILRGWDTSRETQIPHLSIFFKISYPRNLWNFLCRDGHFCDKRFCDLHRWYSRRGIVAPRAKDEILQIRSILFLAQHAQTYLLVLLFLDRRCNRISSLRKGARKISPACVSLLAKWDYSRLDRKIMPMKAQRLGKISSVLFPFKAGRVPVS